MLTQARLKEVFHYDPESGVFTRLKGRGAGSNHAGYLYLSIDQTQYLAHRLAFLYMLGGMPERVDHRDCNKRNNAWANLRPATAGQNMHNVGRRKDNASGVKGVSFCQRTGKWRAAISHDKKWRHLGWFQSIDAAANAYAIAAKNLHQDFANTGDTQ